MQFYGLYSTYEETKLVVGQLIENPLVNRVEVLDEPSDLRYKVMVEWRTVSPTSVIETTTFGSSIREYRKTL